MIEHQVQLRAHEQALQARAGRLPPQGRPPAFILDSWGRSLHAGVDADAPATVPVVEAADLAHRRAQAAHVRRLAQAQLETLSQQIAGSNFLLAFADHDGVVLDLYADNRFSMSGDSAGIVAGSVWRESLCGTNGLGTALATGTAVAVSGLEHYSLSLGDLSCTAAPVRDARGDVVGALDASSYYDSRQRHTQALVQMAATHIENDLLRHQMRRQTVLALHPRAEYLGTLSAGLLAFDGDGRLQALNARARQILAGLNPVAGTAFEALFGAAFDRLLAPLPVGAELRLRDVLGSALVAKVLDRPAQPLPTAAAQRRAALARTTPQARGPSTTGTSAPARAPQRVATPDFVADDPAVIEVCRTVQGAVRLAVPVLIQGETGSGKELLARHAHELSGRRGAFVAVNCGALPDELFEAELFGHVGGAFTGARREGSIGLIASADGGTLLLDEVRELPLHLQAALLRFLDDRLVRPVGGTQSRRVDVQLLAASPVDLADEVAARRFRDDLMYRLAIVKVTLPPLRQRRDFDRAARHVLATLDANARLSDAAVTRLARHDWPGNFRELRAVLTRALLARQLDGDDGVTIDADALAPLLPASVAAASPASALQHGADALVRLEFERCGGNVSRTSRNLGISRTTVYRHLRDAGVPGT